MKKMIMATVIFVGIMAGIIAVQMILAKLFTWQVGEIFSKAALAVLFYYSVCRMVREKR